MMDSLIADCHDSRPRTRKGSQENHAAELPASSSDERLMTNMGQDGSTPAFPCSLPKGNSMVRGPEWSVSWTQSLSHNNPTYHASTSQSDWHTRSLSLSGCLA